MNIKFLGLTLIAISSSSFADYKISASISQSHSETKDTESFGTYKDSLKVTGLDAQLFFSGVSTGNSALREAGFLSKSSSLYVQGHRRSYTHTYQPNDTRFDGDSFSGNLYTEKLGGYGVINDKIFVGGSVENFQGNALLSEVESGVYLGDNALITGVLGSLTYDDEYDESAETLMGVKYHQVFMPQNTFSIATDLQVRKIDKSRHSIAEVSFYFSQKQGVSIFYEGDYDSGQYASASDEFGVGYHIFFNENFGGEIHISNGDVYQSDKGTTYGLALNLNF